MLARRSDAGQLVVVFLGMAASHPPVASFAFFIPESGLSIGEEKEGVAASTLQALVPGECMHTGVWVPRVVAKRELVLNTRKEALKALAACGWVDSTVSGGLLTGSIAPGKAGEVYVGGEDAVEAMLEASTGLARMVAGLFEAELVWSSLGIESGRQMVVDLSATRLVVSSSQSGGSVSFPDGEEAGEEGFTPIWVWIPLGNMGPHQGAPLIGNQESGEWATESFDMGDVLAFPASAQVVFPSNTTPRLGLGILTRWVRGGPGSEGVDVETAKLRADELEAAAKARMAADLSSDDEGDGSSSSDWGTPSVLATEASSSARVLFS